MILECFCWVVVVDSLVFDRCSHSQAGVASLAVVEDLEVFEDGVGQFDTGPPPLTVEKFDLHPGPERFDDGVVETVADGSHGCDQSGLTGPVGERP